ncbi:hypothetical protein CONPUDRAFT_147212 [Coniophora puteana RWD-64-598 SS2]|uniref:Geranylgeranyl pyrophosphate synthetase n=1 Tax=Coniophora puteana (strain RWD-64-598) TaxID=741705 RepID=A0A5M3M9Y5_CONPW|nr:uncharacterized protein CONPUDRAFT_147212 [Coniophora puteana RWD-64-598 SS2]EIW75664.1 hypothetical protein CONPUDRAFT_147212 [Coniophora puteana RWD-64-598 SS2]
MHASPYKPPQARIPHFTRVDLGERLVILIPPSTVPDIVQITDVKPVASYSCVPSKYPKLVIPGSPNIWTDNIPKRVKKDRETRMQERKEACFSSPVPLFIAVDTLHDGKFKYDTLDVITDRNSLRKLLRWVTGSNSNPFRIDVQRSGKTCIFTKVKTADHSAQTTGYGLGFEAAATRPGPGCEGTYGHYRIITYDFGGLQVLIRFEVDACLSADTNDNVSDELASALSELTVDTSTSTRQANVDVRYSDFGLSVELQSSRELVPQSSLIDLVTRTMKGDVRWQEVFPQMYLSQTEYLYIARHERGMFGNVEKVRLNGAMSDEIARRRRRVETVEMPKLKAALDAILSVVRKVDDGVQLSLVRERGELALYKLRQGKGPGESGSRGQGS